MSKRMAGSATCFLSMVLVLALLVLVSGFASAQTRSVTSFFVQEAKLTASDGADSAYFGNSVAISGDTVVISSYESTYLFEKPVTGWDDATETAKLTASGGALPGSSVSISGDTVVVGAIWDDDSGDDSGSAYVFERDAGGPGNWGQVAKLTASDGAEYDQFGCSVSISGDTVVVGAHLDDDGSRDSGSTYVFERDAGGPDNWGEMAKLTASDGAEYDYFGESVAISGDTVVVGARYDDDNGEGSGSVYLFEKPEAGWEDMTETDKLTASDGAAGDYFGFPVSISGDTIVAGADGDDDNGDGAGSAYVYERDAGGPGNWGEVAKLTASDGAAGDDFGGSVSISGDTVVIGAWEDDDNGENSGSAYMFEQNEGGPGTWGQVAKLTASDGAEWDMLGFSVSISGDAVVVSAIGDDDAVGSAYVLIEFEPVAWVYLPVVLRNAP